VDRCGELLKEFDARSENAKKQKGDNPLLISRTNAGAEAGLSRDQIKTAVRVASVPREEFERAAESEKPGRGRIARLRSAQLRLVVGDMVFAIARSGVRTVLLSGSRHGWKPYGGCLHADTAGSGSAFLAVNRSEARGIEKESRRFQRAAWPRCDSRVLLFSF